MRRAAREGHARSSAGGLFRTTSSSKLYAAALARGAVRGARDAAILALLFGAGLRRAEAVGVDFEQIGEGDPLPIQIIGKGDKERTVYVGDGARRALLAWIAIRGKAPGPLILPTLAHVDAIESVRRYSAEGLRNELRRIVRAAGIRHCTPHDLRRTFVSGLLDAGADLPAVQRLAGHADPETTVRYDRRGERAARSAAARLRIPFG